MRLRLLAEGLMATWHQRKGGYLPALYQPHDTEWKVVIDQPNEPAGTMLFTTEQQAIDYQHVAGGTVIPPKGDNE